MNAVESSSEDCLQQHYEAFSWRGHLRVQISEKALSLIFRLPMEKVSAKSDLNQWPSELQSLALPLSYPRSAFSKKHVNNNTELQNNSKICPLIFLEGPLVLSCSNMRYWSSSRHAVDRDCSEASMQQFLCAATTSWCTTE